MTYYTIFFEDDYLSPQDFYSYGEAKEYGEEMKKMFGVEYTIESLF